MVLEYVTIPHNMILRSSSVHIRRVRARTTLCGLRSYLGFAQANTAPNCGMCVLRSRKLLDGNEGRR